MKRRVFFGIGSNLGDRVVHLRLAVDMLPNVVQTSSVFETEPVGGPEQQNFYNCVVECRTDLAASELLQAAQACETAANRVRKVRFGPRTLDVDVLWIEGEVVERPDLVVPHPRMHERRFVLEPLRELAPELVDEKLLVQSKGSVERLSSLDRL